MNAYNRTQLPWILVACLTMLFAYGCGGGGGGGDTSGRYTLEYDSLHVLVNEGSATQTHRGLLGLGANSGTIVVSDVMDVDLIDSNGTSIVALNDGFYSDNLYYYDCTGAGACTQSGPVMDIGLWAIYHPLATDTYSYDVEMENGQILSGSGDFPGAFALPCIANASMVSDWNNGDLDLSWNLPSAGTTNWDRVTQLRVLIMDGNGDRVLHVKLDPTVDEVTIPAALAALAAALGNGTLAEWQVQTRAYDGEDKNYARGYSVIKPLPTP